MPIDYIKTLQAVELASHFSGYRGSVYVEPKILWIGEHVFLMKTVGYNYERRWYSPQVELRSVETPNGYFDAHNWNSRTNNTLMLVKRSPGEKKWWEHFDGPCGPLTEKALAGLIADAEAADARWLEEKAVYAAKERAEREARKDKEQAHDALQAARGEVWATKDAVVEAAVAFVDRCFGERDMVLGDAVESYEAALAALAALTQMEGEAA